MFETARGDRGTGERRHGAGRHPLPLACGVLTPAAPCDPGPEVPPSPNRCPGASRGPSPPSKNSLSGAGSALSLGALNLGMDLKGEKHLGIGRGTLQGDAHQSPHRPQDLLRVALVEIAFELQIEVF